MKTLHYLIIVTIGMVITMSSFNDASAQNVTNSSNVISPIPSSILHSPVPTLPPPENQSIVDVALAIPELQNWSHDWKYVGMGFGSNNKAASGDFEWQYAIVTLKAPSSSAPIPCDNDWWAWIEIDMTTMKVVQATYPTIDSHQCEVAMGGGSVSSHVIVPVAKSPLKQFKSGIAATNITCNSGSVLIIKWEDGSPACVTPLVAKILYERGWTWSATPDKPIGIMARVLYGATTLTPCLDNCSANHFHLDIKTASKSYLLGYNICDGNSCTKNSLQSYQTPNLQNNFLSVPLSDELNSKWKVGDVVDIKVLVSPVLDNTPSTFLDLGNSTIMLATGQDAI